MKLPTSLLPFGNRCILALSASLVCSTSPLSYAALLTVNDLTAGDLLITEVMANPDAVSDNNGEWFEVINTTANEIDLNGILLRDNNANQHLVASESALILQSGAYFTFGRSGDNNANGGFQSNYTYSDFTLSNTSDAIILETASALIDSLIYNGSPFSQAGNSAELTSSGFLLTSAEFVYGLGDIGSPGRAGSFFPTVDTTDPDRTPDIVSVPEPATGLLIIIGISSLLASRRKLSW